MADYPRRNHRHRGKTTFATPTTGNRHSGKRRVNTQKRLGGK